MRKIGAVIIALLMLAGVLPAGAESSLTNVAQNKTVTAGNWSAAYPKENLVDGNEETYVNQEGTNTDNENGTPSDYNIGSNWYQVDLGASYYIDNVVLKADSVISWASSLSIKISVSNSRDFAESTVLLETAEWEEISFPCTLQSDGEAYRYVRLEKLNMSMNFDYAYTELEVWADENDKEESEAEPEPENVALGKTVTAGAYNDYYLPSNVTDGKADTYTCYDTQRTNNANGVASEKNNAWVQVDLGARYMIENISFGFEGWTTGSDFAIQVSNEADFSEAVTLFTKNDGDYLRTSPQIINGDGNYYRYVRYQRLPGSIGDLHGYTNIYEIEVWSTGELKTNITALAEDNKTVKLTFGREMDFADITGITAEADGNPVAVTAAEVDERSLTLTFNGEMNGKKVKIKLPEEMQSSDEIKLKEYDLTVEFPKILRVENFSFTETGFNADVINQTEGMTGSCVIIAAYYNGDNMVAVSDMRITAAGGETVPVSHAEDLTGISADSICVYIWDSYSSAEAVVQTFVIEK